MAVEPNQSLYQRIRYGLTGLAVVFLVVLLGAALRRMGEDSPPPPPQVEVDPTEPLAEIGAAPGQVAAENEAAAKAAPPATKAP